MSREDVIQSAIRFLQDPKVQQSPLAKRIAFLEGKGLSSEEIEQALARAGGGSATTTTTTTVANAAPPVPPGGPGAYPPPGYPQYPLMYAPQPPPPSQLNWKDYTLGAVGVVGAGYGLYVLAKRHILPRISWPTESSVTDDTNRINQQLVTSSNALEAVQAETGEIMKAVEAHAANVNASLDGMNALLKEMKEAEAKGDQEMKSIKDDIEGLRVMIPKMLDKSKEAQTAVITDLQNEIKSLKNLLLNRRLPLSTPGGPSSPSPTGPAVNGVGSSGASASGSNEEGAEKGAENVGAASSGSGAGPSLRSALPVLGKPAIPAWQLEASESKKAEE
ncbi:peroxisomal membrane protein pex14 [Borealophlyctis nickersoniae]|nr:peroxisomal membrane protein pex14 [Borealophlyctis nickersoniae]